MALNASGNISLAGDRVGESIALELGRSPVEEITLNDTDVRTLIGIGSGAIGMNVAYAKSRVLTRNITLTNNQLEFVLAPNIISGYTAGTTAVTLTINNGVYVFSNNTARAGLTVTGFAVGDTIAIVNNGFIIGRGGNGGSGNQVGGAGGPAMRINNDVTITNNSYIAGGGGGGGSTFGQGGGGGAGGGFGGTGASSGAGIGGAPGSVGGNSGLVSGYYPGGGGGGRILPGTGGIGHNGYGFTQAPQATGGGAGGGGTGSWTEYQEGSDPSSQVYVSSGRGGNGGAANNVGQNAYVQDSPGENAAGGGGGWGAAGGRALLGGGGAGPLGGAGGAAIIANNNAINFVSTGTVYGAITGNAAVASVVLSSNTIEYTFNPAKVTGYVAGSTRATLTINAGVYLYSTSTATPALTISGWTAGDQVTIINNGFIIGMGGVGGSTSSSQVTGSPGAAGGSAISLGFSVNITNNSYIAGGGGGGGGGNGNSNASGGRGGGGAGGGAGGGWTSAPVTAGGAGGNPGSSGANGGTINLGGGAAFYGTGGGGGRILPGTGGTGNAAGGSAGQGGGAGGGGAGGAVNDPGGGGSNENRGGNGGAAGNAGSNGTDVNSGLAGGGGGGGWGAAGGSGGGGAGGVGGKAVNLNGYTVTWNSVGTRYGAIS